MIKRVIFDVDGTLISKDDIIRPGVLDLMLYLKNNNIKVVMWSGGGVDYADLWSRRIDPENKVGISILQKSMQYATKSDFVVDDVLDVVELAEGLCAGGYKVVFFEPLIYKDDNEMMVLKEIIESAIS
jgi:FMN phosphatase YigB (HAD superfamily)